MKGIRFDFGKCILTFIMIAVMFYIVVECFSPIKKEATAETIEGVNVSIRVYGNSDASSHNINITNNTIDSPIKKGTIIKGTLYLTSDTGGTNSDSVKFSCTDSRITFDGNLDTTYSINPTNEVSTTVCEIPFSIDTSKYSSTGPDSITINAKVSFDSIGGYVNENITIHFTLEVGDLDVTYDMPDVTYGEYSSFSNFSIKPLSFTAFTISFYPPTSDTAFYTLNNPYKSYSNLLDAGDYSVHINVPTTPYFDGYNKYDKTFTHTVAKQTPTFTLGDSKTLDGITPKLTYTYAGETAEIESSKYKLQYKAEGDSDYSDSKPSTGGKIYVKAVITDSALSKNLNDPVAIFENEKNPGKAKITVSDIKYGESPKIKIETEDYDKDKAYITYKKSGAPDEDYSKNVPTIPDHYVVRVVLLENDKFSQIEEECKFIISKIDGTGTVSAKDSYVGMKPSVALTSNKYNIDTAKLEYKLSTAADSAYSATVPTKEGTYTVRATFPENDCYFEYKTTASFKLSYIPSPGYTISGIKGKNNYYTSDVSIKAPAGYLISTSPDSGFVNELKYSTVSQSKYMYFKETATGALSDKVDIPTFSIDNKAPAFNKKITNNDIIYIEEEEFTINDDNLDSVKVNGKEVPVTKGRASITLPSNGGKESYTITAIDKAGNEVTYTITVSSPWLETGIIPIGKPIKLEKGTGYKLESGEWKVSGDDTVYAGGCTFYVASDQEVEFTKN